MIITADLHIGLVSDSIPHSTTGLPTKLQHSLDRLKEMSTQAQWSDKRVLIAGDIFDTNSPKAKVVNMVMEILSDYTEEGVTYYIISGNHDCSTSFDATELLSHINGVEVFTDDESINTIPGIEMHFRGHQYMTTRNGKFSYASYETHNSDKVKCRILVSHATAKGIGFTPSEVQDYETGNTPIYDPQELGYHRSYEPLNEIYDLVFLGHIHTHTVLQSGPQTIIYPGSPTVCDFSEANDVKGYIEFDVKTLKWEFHEFVYTESSPKYKTIHLYYPTAKDNIIPKHMLDVKGCFLKVVVHTSSYTTVNEKEIRHTFEEHGAHVVRFQIQDIRFQRGKIEDEGVLDTSRKLDHLKLLYEWVQSGREIPTALKDPIYQLGSDVIERVTQGDV